MPAKKILTTFGTNSLLNMLLKKYTSFFVCLFFKSVKLEPINSL